eukprot:jgi/Mesvir1/25439/Mv01714-RA.5
MAFAVMDTAVYRVLKEEVARSQLADATLAVFETSVEALEDVRAGRNVVVLDSGIYTQGYLALALAAAEQQTGQMVTSDVHTRAVVYGGGNDSQSLPVTDDVMRREVCRTEGNPVCGDPGVVPVTPSGCHCFDRRDVRVRVISGLPGRLPFTLRLYQGVADAKRDIPASTFDWHMYEQQSYSVVGEYEEFIKTHRYNAAISLDTLYSDTSAQLSSAIRSISEAGYPLYLAYGRAYPFKVEAFLARFGARNYVGVDPYCCGREISRYGVSQGSRHVLGYNEVTFLPFAWEIMRGVVTGVVGEDYPFPPDIWTVPVTDHGDPAARTGAWKLFVAPANNNTAQIMNGMLPLVGDAFVPSLSKRLSTDVPAPDLLVLEAYHDLISSATMAMLADLAAQNPSRPPVQLITHKCTSLEFLALARQGLVKGEWLLAGCMDEQPYLSTYIAANLAALELQTGERVVGAVNTSRLLKAYDLPRNFVRRVSCEMDGFNRGISKGRLGVFYPVCDVRNGCVRQDLNSSRERDMVECSAHGSCLFPTKPNAFDMTDPTQGECLCSAGWAGHYCERSTLYTPPQPLPPVQKPGPRVLLIALLSIGMAMLLVATIAALVVWRYRRTRGDGRRLQELLGKRSPPRRGQCIAAVVTDVEGSTSLWEWNPDVMNVALAIHHKVIRTLLPKYHGYESDTEGDSFTLVFHDAIDALGWAVEVQRRLLFPRAILGRSRASAPARARSLGDCPSQNWAPSTSALGGDGSVTDWPAELLQTEGCKELKDTVDGSVLYRGLRVRMGIHIGVPDACSMHPNGRQHYQGEIVALAKAIADAAASGGQVLMSMDAWHSLGMHMRSVVCHHMGMHEVCDRLPRVNLMQVLPLEQAKRAPFKPLRSKQLSASFFDAPCATECYLTGEPPREPLVICFIYVGGAKLLSKVAGYPEAVALLVEFVQGRLLQYKAYECEEKDGMFLLAFASAEMATRFAEFIQREAMALPWPPTLLEHEAAAEVVKLGGQVDGSPRLDCVVFRGLRLQIGMCMGVPNDCQPHPTTGRAAYVGPVVNRAARITATAAHGQTLANQRVYEGAKGLVQGITFQELGEFGLKGVREPLRLYEISSPALSLRLFPRTLKLAKSKLPPSRYEVEGDSGQPQAPVESRRRTWSRSPPNAPPSMLPTANCRSPEGSSHGPLSPPSATSVMKKAKSGCMGHPPRMLLPEDPSEMSDMSYDELLLFVKYLLAENKMLRGAPNGAGAERGSRN